jgi:hypothetical protein
MVSAGKRVTTRLADNSMATRLDDDALTVASWPTYGNRA